MLLEAAKSAAEDVSQCSPGTVTPLRIEKAQYALNLLPQIPVTPFLSHGDETDKRGTCAALAPLLGSFKPILGQPDGSFAHLQGDTGTPPPLRSHC